MSEIKVTITPRVQTAVVLRTGATGLPGAQGIQGIKGDTGIGLTGATGPQGPAGAASTIPGPQGIQGPAGAASTVPGPQGVPGQNGSDASVTSGNITTALGYTPDNPTAARTPTAHTHTKSQITDFPTLATVATSGSYADLSNKPSVTSFQPNPETLADSVSSVLYNIPSVGTQRFTKNTISLYIYGNYFIEKRGAVWVAGFVTHDGEGNPIETIIVTSLSDGTYPWQATWPSGTVVEKAPALRLTGQQATENGTEGTSLWASRADHTHPIPPNLPDQPVNSNSSPNFNGLSILGSLSFQAEDDASLGIGLRLPTRSIGALDYFARANAILRDGQFLYFGTADGLNVKQIMVQDSANASWLNEGTLSDSRLSANVSLDNQNNNFSASQTFAGSANTAPNQTAESGSSLMTRDLVAFQQAFTMTRGLYKWSNFASTYAATNVGTGQVRDFTDVLEFNSGTTAGSIAFARSNTFNFRVWHKCLGTGRAVVDWSSQTFHSVRIFVSDLSGSDTVARLLLGQVNTNTTAQDLTSSNKGIGFKIINNEVFVQAANGSAVNTVTTGFSVVALREYDLTLYANNGSWTAYINGTQVAIGTGGPTGNSLSGHNANCMSVTNGTTAAIKQFYIPLQQTLQL